MMMKRLLFRSRVLNNGRWLRQPLSVGEKRSLSGGAASSRKPCSSGGGSLFRVGANRTVVAPFAASNDYRRHYSELLLSSGTFITQHDKGSTARCSFFSTSTSPSKLSKRDVADLEERLWRRVGSSVSDPVLNRNVATDLQWLHRRIAISDDGTIQLLLKLPSLLHPSLTQLKDEIKDAAEKELQVWLNEKGMALRNDVDSEEGDNSSTPTSSAPMMKVNVEAMATKPVPMMARLVEDPKELLDGIGPGLANVGHFLAVYSCKGGVGKSTIAVNLAYEMARMGGRVGIVDLDIYGPSLPVLVQPPDTTIRRSPLGKGMVFPIEHEGVKLLSLGFVSINSGVPGSGQENGASVMRGPMAGKVVTQLLKGTDWGELDVLILDLPPGTGDVQLQVLQDLQLTGAVAVTTPSKLAAVDTRKGIEMFTSLGVPTLSVVENMSYFQCEGGGKHFPFGKGLVDQPGKDGTKLAEVSSIVQLPISVAANTANDNGNPLCVTRPDEATEELSAFRRLAENVSGEILKLQFGGHVGEVFVTFGSASDEFDLAMLQLSLDKSSDQAFVVRLFGEFGAIQKRISSAELRARDPKSGDVIEASPFADQLNSFASSADDPVVTVHKASGKVSPSLLPVGVEKKGLYGFAVRWSDGATIIYSKKSIAVAAGGTIKEGKV